MSSTEGIALAPGSFLVRPATSRDAAALHALIIDAEGELERFEDTLEAAAAAIENSERSLRGEMDQGGEPGYLLLIEDTASRQVIGCVGLACRIGLDQPFYEYRLGKIVHSSRPLASYRCLEVLYLCNDLTGCSEMHSLYVRRDFAIRGASALLLKAVQLFIASRPAVFAPRIIVELRGVTNHEGNSPFWESIGRHFFGVDQRRAEKLVAKGRKAFIAELMPKHPVYVSLLPEAAQQAVGGVHQQQGELTPLLEAAGFHFESHVDIFDGGRVLEGHTQELAGVVGSRLVTAQSGEPGAAVGDWWLAIGSGADFRVRGARGVLDGGRWLTDPATLTGLGLGVAASVRVLAA